MKITRLSRGYMVQTVENREGILKYDIELAYGGRVICKLSTECIGEQSAEYWHDYEVKVMKRFMYLIEGIDKANNNLMIYSKNLLMNEPKPEFEERWNETQDRLDMLHEWLQDMTDGFNDKAKTKIRNEFDMYYE